MKTSSDSLSYLESLFVREFRASQALHMLTQQERLSLSRDDAPRLFALAKQKESILDELAGLEDAKFSMLQELGIAANGSNGALYMQKLIDFLQAIDAESAERMLRLQEGVLMLMNRVRELSRGNQALATNALQRANMLQSSLLSAYQFPLTPGVGQRTLPVVFAAIINARNALHADDTRAIATALGELQYALENVTHFLDSSERPETQPQSEDRVAPHEPVAASPQPDDEKEASLVEMIASLHRQENAYQASLKVNSRMLATA